jgi:predicted AlkP superfamily phosphohydrolase/phosphomutase
MHRVFMIGWDGATFDLILPWVKQGLLPNIGKLLENGVHGPLRSTIPPWTFPAWNSFMTGQNPGKHGIFDFFRARAGSYDVEFVNGGHRRSPTFWQLLSRAGRRVVAISIPCTFPPEPVNGVMISGFDFPGEGPGSFIDAKGVHPPEFYAELLREVGPHPIDTPIARDINAGRPEVALEKVLHTIRSKAATARYLLNRSWDCFMVLFGESDGAGHQFWKYCDPHSPLFVDRPAMRDSILRIYQELDRQTGALIAALPADTTILMMSDHGFGGASDWVIYPNRWLEEKSFLTFRNGCSARWSRCGERLKHWGSAHFPAWLQRFLYRCAAPLLGRFESRIRHGMTDWSRTEAYFEENPYFPVLRVNLKGRQPHGTVEPGAHYEAVRDRLIGELESWRHPETGARIVEKAYRREEIYSGPHTREAADVIPKWALHEGYNYSFRLSSKSAAGVWIERLGGRQEYASYFNNKSGSHRDDGIFLACGPDIPAGQRVETARIIDLAPTILHMLGVAVPADMDGRILNEVVAAEAARTDATPLPAPSVSTDNGAYSAEDERKIAERLQALGYVE